MKRYCLALDLRSDPVLQEQYLEHHRAVWPEILDSIRNAGVLDMQIYRSEERLLMIMDTTDEFTFERKAAMDLANPKVLEWEELMSRYQKVSKESDPTQRWQPMERIFNLKGDSSKS